MLVTRCAAIRRWWTSKSPVSRACLSLRHGPISSRPHLVTTLTSSRPLKFLRRLRKGVAQCVVAFREAALDFIPSVRGAAFQFAVALGQVLALATQGPHRFLRMLARRRIHLVPVLAHFV